MIDWLLTHAPVIALFIGLLGIIAKLGWDFYQRWSKPKLRVELGVKQIFGNGVSRPPMLIVSATNCGLGEIMCDSLLQVKRRRWGKPSSVVHYETNPPQSLLPKRLNIAEKLDLIFPYDKDCFLKLRPTHVGLGDSFGGYHWAPRKQVRRAIAKYKRDFSNPFKR
jgi:hypothetical protein